MRRSKIIPLTSLVLLLTFKTCWPATADSLANDVAFLEKDVPRFLEKNKKSSYGINKNMREIIIYYKDGQNKILGPEFARFLGLNYCLSLSLNNELNYSWRLKSFSHYNEQIPAAECIISKYNGPDAALDDLALRPPPPPQQRAEGKKMRALIMENRTDETVYRTWATAGDDGMGFDSWHRTISRFYVAPRSLAWVLRDAASVCEKLNSSSIATANWHFYVRILPALDPVASCVVGPGGTALTPLPPPLGPDEPPAEVEIDAWHFEHVLYDRDYPGSLAAVRAAFVSWRYELDRKRRRIDVFFEGIRNEADTRYFFDRLVCTIGPELRTGGFVTQAWDFYAHAAFAQGPFAHCRTAAKG